MKNKAPKICLVIISVIIILAVLVFRGIGIVSESVEFALLGDQVVQLEWGGYQDPGFSATSLFIDLNDQVKVSSNLDLQAVGSYQIDYSLDFLGQNHHLVRKITIVDSVKPEIELNGASEIKLYVGDKLKDEGAHATDNYDGDLTEKIEVSSNVDMSKAGDYQIDYTVKDSSGNENSVTRLVTVVNRPVVVAVAPPPASVEPVTDQEITDYIKKKGYNVAVGYYNLVTGKTYFYNESKMYYGASLIKTLDAVYLYDKGLVTDELKPYIRKAISVSDNDAHRYLVNQIGKKNLSAYGIALGAPNSLADPTDDYFSDTTIKDQMAYLKKLYSVSNTYPELRTYFINNNYNYLKINTNTTMHKYGYYGSFLHDVGIIFDQQPYILVVLTAHGSAGGNIIRDLSNLIYRYHRS